MTYYTIYMKGKQGRITVLSPEGKVLGHLDVPAQVVSNITFGGAARVADPNTKTDSAAQQQGSESAAELAKKLSNPVASLISVPFQYNFDYNVGVGGIGSRSTLIIQPVIPFKLNPNWNLISRTITPIIHQSDVTGPNQSQTGLGDIVQSLFFSPSKTKPFIWGVGPVLVIPTATNTYLGGSQLGLGPTFLILQQKSGWTYGLLMNHAVRVAGSTTKPKLNTTFLQPILAYGTKTGWTYSLTMESTYDWTGKQWSIPVGPAVSKLVRFGKQPVSFQGAFRCWASRAPNSANNCSFRFTTTLLFPA